MKSFGLKGGLFYSIFKNSHYAYRELVFRQIIPDSADPEQLVTGEEFLQIVNRVLDLQDQNGQPRMETERREAEQQRMAAEINTHLVERQVQDTKVSVGTEGVTISLSNINFQANSARLEEDEQAKIREIAEILKTLPGRKIMVAGHTALAGTEEAQMRTSTERAQAVADYLIQLGVRRRSEITVLGYGASRPVAPNTSAGQAQNRRVEITILERL
jgi:outer membrane protein OmpA-like peptidoglycan-associated protein